MSERETRETSGQRTAAVARRRRPVVGRRSTSPLSVSALLCHHASALHVSRGRAGEGAPAAAGTPGPWAAAVLRSAPTALSSFSDAFVRYIYIYSYYYCTAVAILLFLLYMRSYVTSNPHAHLLVHVSVASSYVSSGRNTCLCGAVAMRVVCGAVAMLAKLMANDGVKAQL